MLNRLVSLATVVLASALAVSSATAPGAQQPTAPAQTQRSAPHATVAAQQSTQSPAGVISAAPESVIRPVPENYRYQNGQTLHYSAEWRLFNAGTATLRMEAASAAEQKITATADSTGVVALLYRVQDRFESWFDRRTFCSSRINKHSEEGIRKRDTQIRFDQLRKKAVLDEKNLRNGETKRTEQDIPGCVADVLSGIYYVASLPLQPGSTYVFPVNDGGKTYDVKAYVEGREEIKTDAGTFRTVRVQPSAESGVLKSRGKIWIWYTDDAAHIPVQMRARMFWGTLTFKLVRIDRQ